MRCTDCARKTENRCRFHRTIRSYTTGIAPHGSSPTPQSLDAFVEKVYAPLEDTQVGALFWSAGGRGSRWPSEVVEFIGQERDRPYASASAYNGTENILQMYDRGEDPQQALIARGHELGVDVLVRKTCGAGQASRSGSKP